MSFHFFSFFYITKVKRLRKSLSVQIYAILRCNYAIVVPVPDESGGVGDESGGVSGVPDDVPSQRSELGSLPGFEASHVSDDTITVPPLHSQHCRHPPTEICPPK
jgi:hypothetical protein